MPNSARASSRAVIGVGALAVVGCAGVVLGAALPWLDTGGVRRSAFTMARIANEFGVIDTPVRRGAIVALLFTPIVASIVVLLLALHRTRLAGLLSLPMGIAGLGSGTIGTRFTSKHLPGPLVCLAAGALCIVGAWGLLLVPSPKNSTKTEGPPTP